MKKMNDNETKLREKLIETEREKGMLQALCADYTAAYFCDLLSDYIEPIKKKEFSHSAKERKNLNNPNSYSEWIQYSYENIIIKETLPDFLVMFDAQNLMKQLLKEERITCRHKTHANEKGMEYFEVTAVRLYSDKNTYQMILGYRPIDDIIKEERKIQKKLEKALIAAENANKAKTDFLRHMSHDIRTPINGIIGMIEISNRYKDDPKRMEECYKKILASAEYLVSIVNNVLNMKKLENGRLSLKKESFDLVELLAKQLLIVEEQAKENGLIFHGGEEMSTIKHRHLIGSPEHLNRVLMNLANNAIKYNRKGGKIIVYCTELSCNDNMVVYEFVCEDNGLGMSEEFQKHAFEPYAQEGKETLPMYEGTGLGLPIVKQFVEQMNGEIDFESLEDVGTVFKIRIPFEIDFSKEQSENEEVFLNLTGKKALLVEDNELNREIATVLLADEGLKVTAVENGQQALDKFITSEPYTYDIIFMDIMMPVMDGLEVTRKIRAMDRDDAKKIPIIAMSANAFQDDIQKSLTAGMNKHLTKPLDLKKMKSMIQEVLKDNIDIINA